MPKYSPVLQCHFTNCSKICNRCQHRSQTLLDWVEDEAGLGQVIKVDIHREVNHRNDQKCKKNCQICLLGSDGGTFLFLFIFVVAVMVHVVVAVMVHVVVAVMVHVVVAVGKVVGIRNFRQWPVKTDTLSFRGWGTEVFGKLRFGVK